MRNQSVGSRQWKLKDKETNNKGCLEGTEGRYPFGKRFPFFRFFLFAVECISVRV